MDLPLSAVAVKMKVVVGVDAHKLSHTLVAVDPAGLKLGQKTVATTSAAHAEAVRWAAAQFGSGILWAVEDCRTMTARLEDDLLAAGQRVIRVPPHLMSRTRSSARERGKSDPIDALAVARTVLSEPNLPVAVHDPISMELRLLVDRRDDLVSECTATINRLMGRIHLLDPGHPTPRNWKVQKAHRELRDWLITQDGLVAELARDELDDIIRISAVILDLRRRIERTVQPVAPALIALQGCGELTAARIIAEVANVDRFRSEAAFARYAGLAPVPHTSGSSTVRLRPTRQGNRRLNAALHRIAITQTIHDGPGRTYYQRRLAEGDSRHRALRSLKRRLARVVFNRLKACPPAVDGRGRNGHTSPSVFLLPLVDFQAIR
jgi:transposase